MRIGIALAAVLMLCGLGARAASAASAASTKSCADLVIADWYDDGKVGKIYPLQCYRDAIKKLPPDVRDYSNAREEIGRALAFAKLGKPDPGSTPSTTSTGTTTAVTSTQGTGTEQTTTKTTKTGTQETDTTSTLDTATIETTTADTSGPSSVPVPLLVLGGLAVLLLAAGSAGYLRRRMNNGDGDGTPPAPPVA